MSRRLALAVPACLVLLLAACGGSGDARPTAPAVTVATPAPQPTPTAPAVINGWTEQPVAAEVTPDRVMPGAVVTVRAPGFLTREQPFDGRPVALWPAHEGYVGEIVYGWRWSDGRSRMVRWDTGFVVTLEGNLATDTEVVEKVEQILAEVRRTTGLSVRIGSGGAVTVGIDPDLLDQNYAGEAAISTRSGFISSGRIRFGSRGHFFGDDRAAYGNTLLHEFGHVIGLYHSSSDRDVMRPFRRGSASRSGTYSDDETMVLHMMYAHRRTQNVPVDRDPAVGGASALPETLRVVE